MKRITSLVLTLLALTLVSAVTVQAQEPYPPGTTAQQPVDQTTTAADPVPMSDLPATASPMPLVALGGLVSLGAGVLLTRSRRRA